MKITVSQLRKIIKEELESLSEDNLNRTMIIPPVKKPSAPVPMGKKKLPLGFSVEDLLASMTPEQQEEMLQALQSKK